MKAALSDILLRSAVIDGDIPIEGDMRIGREKDCEVQLDDIHISRYHARITVADNLILLEDLGSTNGTFVNGNRIQQQQVVNVGDELRFHHCLFRLVSKQSSDLDQTVFAWPLNTTIEPPKPAESDPRPAVVSLPLSSEPETGEGSGVSPEPEIRDPVAAEVELPSGQVQSRRRSAIERQVGQELRKTRDFLERVQSLSAGSWLVLSGKEGDACVLCTLAARSADGERLCLVADTGLWRFEKNSRELATELQYDRARILDKGPLFARMAVLLTGAMGRARRALASGGDGGNTDSLS